MKLLVLAVIFAVCAQCNGQFFLDQLSNVFGINSRPKTPCQQDPIPLFKTALDDFSLRLTNRASFYSNGHFIASPYTIWLSLASLAEFSDESVKKELFTALNLPEEKCLRDSFYQLALGLELPGPDITFQRSRALMIDEEVNLNQKWVAFSHATSILNYMTVRYEEATFAEAYGIMGLPTKPTLSGHSILFDRLDFVGSWQSAFADGKFEQAPFYNELGQSIATIEFVRMKSKVRLAHLPIMNTKILELPVGSDGRYSMLFIMGAKGNPIQSILELFSNSIIEEIISALTLSLVPIDVAIPRFSMSNGFDAQILLNDLGLDKIFSDPAATRYVSDPPALPCAYLQRVSVNITSASLSFGNNRGSNILTGFLDFASNAATGVASAVGRNFIANRPFLFTLIDSKTKTPVFSGAYSYPQGNNQQKAMFGRIN